MLNEFQGEADIVDLGSHLATGMGERHDLLKVRPRAEMKSSRGR